MIYINHNNASLEDIYHFKIIISSKITMLYKNFFYFFVCLIYLKEQHSSFKIKPNNIINIELQELMAKTNSIYFQQQNPFKEEKDENSLLGRQKYIEQSLKEGQDCLSLLIPKKQLEEEILENFSKKRITNKNDIINIKNNNYCSNQKHNFSKNKHSKNYQHDYLCSLIAEIQLEDKGIKFKKFKDLIVKAYKFKKFENCFKNNKNLDFMAKFLKENNFEENELLYFENYEMNTNLEKIIFKDKTNYIFAKIFKNKIELYFREKNIILSSALKNSEEEIQLLKNIFLK